MPKSGGKFLWIVHFYCSLIFLYTSILQGSHTLSTPFFAETNEMFIIHAVPQSEKKDHILSDLLKTILPPFFTLFPFFLYLSLFFYEWFVLLERFSLNPIPFIFLFSNFSQTINFAVVAILYLPLKSLMFCEQFTRTGFICFFFFILFLNLKSQWNPLIC